MKSRGVKVNEAIVKKLGAEGAHKWRQEIGRLGGIKSRGGGFAKDPKLARAAAKKSWENRQPDIIKVYEEIK